MDRHYKYYIGVIANIKFNFLHFFFPPKFYFLWKRWQEFQKKPSSLQRGKSVLKCIFLQTNNICLAVSSFIGIPMRSCFLLLLFYDGKNHVNSFFLAFLIVAYALDGMQKSLHPFYIIALNMISFTRVTVLDENHSF